MKKLINEFIVENVVMIIDEKTNNNLRNIMKELCKKYPDEKEF
jgi:hypothetical protein